MPGIFRLLPLRGPMIVQPVSALSAQFPSGMVAVMMRVRIWLSFQPFSCSARPTASASGASIEAVTPASASWISTP